MDLAQATGAAETIALGDEEHAIRLLTLKEWGVIAGWLKRENPSPITRALVAIQQAADSGERISQAVQDQMLDHAQRAALAWPPRFDTPEWYAVIDNIDGGWAKVLYEVLIKTEPEYTIERAEILQPKVTLVQWRELIRVAVRGEHPSVPKDGAANGMPSP